MSFDLIVWALGHGTAPADVRAAHERCRQGNHAKGGPEPRISSFYQAITADYPDRPGPGTPWAVTPLHIAADHVEMKLDESCADQVLLDIERLAGVHGLVLLDPQDGSVYPPPTTVTG